MTTMTTMTAFGKKCGVFIFMMLALGVTPVYSHGITMEALYPFIFIYGFLVPYFVTVLIKKNMLESRYQDLLFASDVKKAPFYAVTAVEQVVLSGLIIVIFSILEEWMRGTKVLIFSIIAGMVIFYLCFPVPLLNMKYLSLIEQNRDPPAPLKRLRKDAYLLSSCVPIGMAVSVVVGFLTFPIGFVISIKIAELYL
jgi:hypothetical protein